MNNKYFGNALDLFKFDVIEHITKKDGRLLFYAPMLTTPETKKLDPKYIKYEVGENNTPLLTYMKKTFEAQDEIEVKDIRRYFKEANINYQMVVEESDNDSHSFSLRNIKFFNDENRSEYFEAVIHRFKKIPSPALFFIDPDVGLEHNVIRRVRSMRHRYLLNDELKTIIQNCKENDLICYFQHLGNHNYPIEKRIIELREEFGEHIVLFGYKRILGSLVFIAKNNVQIKRLKSLIEDYRNGYRNMGNYDKIIFE